MATHSSILAWRIPWTEEPDGLQSMGSQRVGHDQAIKQQHLLMDTWVSSMFWLLWILLLWRWVYKYAFETQVSILLGIYPDMQLLDNSYWIFNFLRSGQTVFYHNLHYFTFPPTVYTSFSCSALTPVLVIYLFIFLVIVFISGTLLTTFPSAWLTPTSVSVLCSDVTSGKPFPGALYPILLARCYSLCFL